MGGASGGVGGLVPGRVGFVVMSVCFVSLDFVCR